MKAKKKILKNEKVWREIKDLISLITKISDDYDEKYLKSNLIWMTNYI